MTDADDQLSRLFREDPAPDRDQDFADRVMVDVDRLRRKANILLAGKVAAILAILAVAAAVLSRITGRLPDLSGLYGGGEVMSVPWPLFALAIVLVIATQLRGVTRRRSR